MRDYIKNAFESEQKNKNRSTDRDTSKICGGDRQKMVLEGIFPGIIMRIMSLGQCSVSLLNIDILTFDDVYIKYESLKATPFNKNAK
ncbi:Hypothetical predicted protein [Octopus vulgaris]|uniref:Uncharacterized protein n=1 Tax=Octopus vulgaris TaxID=6645 RepID=A0AA36F7Y7_OCTVU|nr:Hypothetical predicted protein [Octopus vulgaris]